MYLYGEQKSRQEIITFLDSYFEGIKSNQYDRYYTIMDMFPHSGDGKVLDYGCGWGFYSNELNQRGFHVTGIDISENDIEICTMYYGKKKGLSFLKDNIESFNEMEFDYVLSNQVIEHVHNVGNYLSEINRVLKEDGRLIISLPNIMNPRFFLNLLGKNREENFKSLSKEILNHYDKGQHHINGWDPRHFVILCASVGFELEKYVPTEGIAIPFQKYMNPYIHLNIPRIKNWSYTMTFRFKKVKNVEINKFD